MNVSHLQGAQSFQVKTVEGKLSPEQLKALENNGQVDIVVEDKETHQTHIISGEKIDLQEYNTRMGKADPNFKMGPYYNADLKPLQNMDENKDGFLVEAETKHTAGAAWGQGLDVAGRTIGGGAEVGSMYGMAYGSKVPFAPRAGMAVGVVVGGFLGGAAGLLAAPFKGVGHAVSTQGSQKNVQTWNFTESLKAVR
ncbi:MAG: hypothetical protein AB7I41_16350 [Candidatus Sericytochromatia bacterium]